MAYRGGGFDAGASSNFGNENFGGNQGKNDYSSKPKAKAKAKTKIQKTYSILANVVKGLGKMVTVGRQQNADVKAGLRDPADFSTPGNDGDNNNNTPIIIKKNIGGNTIQTTKAKVEKAADLTAEQILLKNKKRGRASSIMTSSQGVGKTSSNYSLGKTSLLGRV